MGKPRLSPLPKSEWDPEIQDLFEKIGYETEEDLYNVLKTLAHHPKLLKRWLPFANHVLLKSTLTPRIREIVILRTGWLCGSEYEWTQHVRIAKEEAAMNMTDFSALEIGSKDPHWGNEERIALKLCEDLFAFKTVRESTWKELIQYFDHKQVLDMVAAVGNYTMVSMMLNTFQVPLDSWLEKYEAFGVGSAQK